MGLSRLENLEKEIGGDIVYQRVMTFVRESPRVAKVKYKSENWYMYEDRENALINFCEKIFTLADRIDINVLASVLRNALRRRSHKYTYPSEAVIREWIDRSKWFKVSGLSVEFLGESSDLNEIEKTVVDFLSSRDHSSYPSLRDHLASDGYGKPAIDKAVTTSALVGCRQNRRQRRVSVFASDEGRRSKI